MATNDQIQILKDLPNKKITVIRNFNAKPEQVWKAWTESELLDKWWAPKPWHAETKSMDFRVGGHWLYAMVGPDGERHWARVDYKSIDTNHSYDATDCFCDENGNKSNEMPSMTWHNRFESTSAGTKVTVEILFPSESDLQRILEMGFEEGFTSALGNLDEYFNTLK
jgi:PhnB protein